MIEMVGVFWVRAPSLNKQGDIALLLFAIILNACPFFFPG
jgi:hypothetical protein